MDEPWKHMLRERQQIQKPHITWFYLFDIFRIGIPRDRKYLSSCQGLGAEWNGKQLLMGMGFLEVDENVLKFRVVMVVWCLNTLKTTELYILAECIFWYMSFISIFKTCIHTAPLLWVFQNSPGSHSPKAGLESEVPSSHLLGPPLSQEVARNYWLTLSPSPNQRLVALRVEAISLSLTISHTRYTICTWTREHWTRSLFIIFWAKNSKGAWL